jgi:hypothetical protein
MNTQTAPEKSPVVVDLLSTAQDDIEQFRKELDHDKVDVHDRYDKLKHEIKDAIRQMKDMIRDNKVLAKDITDSLRIRLAHLEEQVMTPKPNNKEDLIEQLSHVKKLMESIVQYLGKVTTYDLSLSLIHDRIYRYKIKLAIIKLKLQLGTMQLKDTVMDVKFDIKKKFHHLRGFASNSEKGIEKKWKVFHAEISEAYEHLQKAFTSK